jgi:predicted AAA+ superfamily ATPase
LKLFPLDSSEYSGQLETTLRIGTLPGIILDNTEPERSLRAYVHTYLREEIQLEALVRKVDKFARFLEIAGQYHGKIINASNIAKPIGTTPNTVLEYFRILEDTLLGFTIPGWHESTVKQLRTAPKFFLFDNGVANALRGELRIEHPALEIFSRPLSFKKFTAETNMSNWISNCHIGRLRLVKRSIFFFRGAWENQSLRLRLSQALHQMQQILRL